MTKKKGNTKLLLKKIGFTQKDFDDIGEQIKKLVDEFIENNDIRICEQRDEFQILEYDLDMIWRACAQALFRCFDNHKF